MAWGLVAVLVCGCREATREVPAAESRAAVLPVAAHAVPLYSGCQRVRVGPICEVAPGTSLTLWMPSSFGRYQLLLGGKETAATERPVAGGYQVRVEVDAEQAEISLRERSSGLGARLWHLALASHQPSDGLRQANAAKDAGEFERALELVESLKREGSPLESALAEGIQARVYLRQGRASDASNLLLRTSERLLEQGQVSELARDVFARLFILLQRTYELSEARAWLARFREPVSSFPLGRALLGDHEGLLRASGGESVAALQYYREAGRQYLRLGEESHARRVEKEQVGLLSDVGQTVEASELQRALLPSPGESDCAQAQLYTLRAWLTLLELEERQPEPPPSLPALLDDSESWARRCGDPEIILTGLVNRGLWALQQRDVVLAGRVSAELRALPQSQNPELRAWVSELEGRFALARGAYGQARSHFESERAIGHSSGRLDPELRALLGLAKVEQARGQLHAGEQILRQAVLVLDRAEHWAPFGPLLHSQFASRQRAARELVQALVLRKNDAEAYRVGLAAYRSALGIQARYRRIEDWPPAARARWQELLTEFGQRRSALDVLAQGDWQLSTAELEVAAAQRDGERRNLELLLQEAAEVVPGGRSMEALPHPGPGEYWLLVLPTPAGSDPPGWIVLGTDGRDVRSAKLSLSDLASGDVGASTHPLLVPFEAPLSRARSIVFLPAAESRSWPVERWKLRGEPLGRRHLAFGAALGSVDVATPRASARLASVVANPREDLPYSQQEGELAARLLGVPPERLLMGSRATASNLLAQLESAEFLHFAGHARAGGAQGAVLLLAGGSELLPWELFGLRSVPREIVLSACYAAESQSRSVGVGWGFAQSLLALGAEAVIAPVDALDDHEALVVQRRFYKGVAEGLSFREAFWQAQTEEVADMASFRLFVR